MTKTDTRPEPTSPDALGQACEMFLGWDGSVYGTMNMTEGMILSDLFASLGHPEVSPSTSPAASGRPRNAQ